MMARPAQLFTISEHITASPKFMGILLGYGTILKAGTVFAAWHRDCLPDVLRKITGREYQAVIVFDNKTSGGAKASKEFVNSFLVQNKKSIFLFNELAPNGTLSPSPTGRLFVCLPVNTSEEKANAMRYKLIMG